MTEEQIREEIAKLMTHRDYEAGEVWCDWDSREAEAETTRESYREDAVEILSIKGIRLEAENQILPNKWTYAGSVHGDDYNSGYAAAQQDMLKEGWVKCLKKEEQ